MIGMKMKMKASIYLLGEKHAKTVIDMIDTKDQTEEMTVTIDGGMMIEITGMIDVTLGKEMTETIDAHMVKETPVMTEGYLVLEECMLTVGVCLVTEVELTIGVGVGEAIDETNHWWLVLDF
jgi:hypothetical protein